MAVAKRQGKGAKMQRQPEMQVSTVRLSVEQWDALRREAMRRALEKGSAKPDTSEVVREAVDVWRAKRGK